MKKATGNPDYIFNVTTATFPVSATLRGRDESADAVFICIISGIGFALIPASTIGNIVMEKQKGLKHMQIVSGLNLFAYWFSNFIFDVFKVFLPCALSVVCLFLFDMGYTSSYYTILLYPLGVVPFAYVLSIFFETESAAQTFMLFGNVIAGSIAGMAVFILRLIPDTAAFGDDLQKYLKIFPNYLISNSIIYDGSKEAFNSSREFIQILEPDVGNATLEDFSMDNVGGDIYALFQHLIFGMLIVALSEIINNKCAGRVKKINKFSGDGHEVDDDVKAEEKRVERLDAQDCLVRVNKFRKVYKIKDGACGGQVKTKVAVKKTSFAVDKGECFALLGVNGAGKTTTFKSLTKAVLPSAGDLSVMGYDIAGQFS